MSIQNLMQGIFKKLNSNEELNINFFGEDSIFLRFNGSKVRQVTSVKQGILNFQFMENSRSLNFRIPYTGVPEQDKTYMEDALGFCRDKVKTLPVDPFIVPIENHGETKDHFDANLPSVESLAKDIFNDMETLDFVGCFSMGEIERANWNSKGQSHSFKTQNFQLDFSFYTEGQKAVKGLYAGASWDPENLKTTLEQSKMDLEKLNFKPIKLARGKYNVYLAPDAVSEIIDMFSWGAVSYSSLKRGNSALKLLHDGDRKLNEKFNLSENFSLGLIPRFNERGEISPEIIQIIEKGKIKNFLINSRSAKEFGVVSNGASSYEGLRSTILTPGDLKRENILNSLGRGIYISNLHYLNWSDIQRGRFTGMTRFACFYIENGKIVAPIEDLRFDESLYDVFGENLLSLTDFNQVIPNVGSYGMRSLGGKSVPGIIVKDFNFTL